MAENDNNQPFDPHSAPTMMEMSPFYKPEPSEPALPEKDKDIGAVLKEAFELYKTHFALFFVVAAVAMAPVFLVKNVIAAMMVAPTAVMTSGLEANNERLQELAAEHERLMNSGASPEELSKLQAEMLELSAKQFGSAAAATGAGAVGILAMLGLILLTIPLMVLANFLAQGALVVAVSDRLRGGSLDWKGVWSVFSRRIGPMLLTSLLAMLAIGAGLLFCVLPGLALAFVLSLATPVVLLEKRSGIEALKRSVELVKSDWLRVLLVMIVFAVLSAVASAVGGMFIPDRFVFLNGLLGDLVSILVVPVPILGLVIVYEDIVRKMEGASTVAAHRAELLG